MKYKPKKRYKKTLGYRQQYTKIKIIAVQEKTGKEKEKGKK